MQSHIVFARSTRPKPNLILPNNLQTTSTGRCIRRINKYLGPRRINTRFATRVHMSDGNG
jgi:hypothetical protein